MTRHWIEAYADMDTISFRLICEHPTQCLSTAEDMRDDMCAVTAWFESWGDDLLQFPRDVQTVLGRLEVHAEWTGHEGDSVTLVPPVGER